MKIILSCILLLFALAARRASAADPPPAVLRDVGIRPAPRRPGPLGPEFPRRDRDPGKIGRLLRKEARDPGPCLLQVPDALHFGAQRGSQGMRGMSLTPGTDYDVVTVSFDPRETPKLAAAKKKTYVADCGRPARPRAGTFSPDSPTRSRS